MALRRSGQRPHDGADRFDAVQHELLVERAATLERLGGRLEAALHALSAYEASGADDARRDELVDAAAQALWYYVVQREVCGLGGAEAVVRALAVPREVYLRMGTAPRRRGAG